MPLSWLDISYTNVSDIAVLEGMPLVSINMEGCVFIKDLLPLKKSKGLEKVLLPPQVFGMDIEFMRRFKKIRKMDIHWREDRDARSVDDFWREYDDRMRRRK